MECNLDDIIKSSKKILLLSHVNPDGDTLGSMCAMYSMIEKRFKKKVDMSVVSNIPFNYTFLPNIDKAQRYFDQSLVYDLVIALDVAAIDRVRDAKIFFEKAKCTVNIDHHKTNPKYADYNLIEPEASSCGEVLFNYFKKNKASLSQSRNIGYIVLDDKNLDDIEKEYFKHNNIEVIDINKIKTLDNIPDSISMDEGKRLFSFLKILSNPQMDVLFDKDIWLSKIISTLDDSAYIHYKDLLKLLYLDKTDGYNPELKPKKQQGTLIIYQKEIYEKLIDILNNSKYSKKIKQLNR